MILRSLFNFKKNLLFGNFNLFSKYIRQKPHINVGTIGHIDHGKTTLTSAITKILAKRKLAKYLQYGMIDKAPQQKSRGITINTATLEYQTDKRHYGHVDCPGHIDYVKNMITGAAKMDAGILVVSASDGPMPQTKEHLLLCRQIGVQTIIIFLNKCDLIKDLEILQVVEMELKQILKKYQYDPEKVKFIKGSALHAINDTQPQLGENKIIQLLDAMDNEIPIPQRIVDKPFMMPIQNSYSIEGRGIVAVGTVQQGKVKIGDELQLIGQKNKSVRFNVSTIETYGKSLDFGQAGENIGLLIRGINKQLLKRGSLLIKPKQFSPHSVFQASIYCLTQEEGGRKKPFTTGYKPQLYYRTADTQAHIAISGSKIAMPGDNTLINFKLQFPLVMEVGARFALRQNNRTIAAGIVTKVLPDNTKLDFEKKNQQQKMQQTKQNEKKQADKTIKNPSKQIKQPLKSNTKIQNKSIDKKKQKAQQKKTSTEKSQPIKKTSKEPTKQSKKIETKQLQPKNELKDSKKMSPKIESKPQIKNTKSSPASKIEVKKKK